MLNHLSRNRWLTKNPAKSLGILALGLPLTASAQSQQVSSPTATTQTNLPVVVPSAGLLNDYLREQWPGFNPWDIGGQLRVRLEVKDYLDTPGQPGQVAFRKIGGNANNTYVLFRAREHVGYTDDWFAAYLETQQSASPGDKRYPQLESDPFQLHQGFVALGNTDKFPLLAKVGRQELSYGDERLIGPFDWNNIGRSFDAIKLHYAIDSMSWADAFTSRVVVPRTGPYFDDSDNYDTLSGLYASSRDLMPWQESQVYFLARNTSDNAPNFETGALAPLPSPRDIYTPGLRIKSLPGELDGFDYGIEGAYQFGRFVATTGTVPDVKLGRSLDQRAYMGHAEGGYTWTQAAGTPRVGVEFNYASGDKNPKDNTHGTFDTLFPTTHLITGIMDLYSLQNIEDLRLNFTVKPTHKFNVFASYRGVWLATSSDYFYQANQTPRTGGTPGAGNGYALNPTYGRYVGMEADLVLTYNFTSFAQVQGGYGHFFVGDYVKESLSSPKFGATDADYVYLQAKFNF